MLFSYSAATTATTKSNSSLDNVYVLLLSVTTKPKSGLLLYKEVFNNVKELFVTIFSSISIETLCKNDYLECPIKNIGNKRWTLDEEEDLVFINKIYSHFISVGIEDFKTDDVLFFLKDNPNIESINNKYERNEGLKKSIKNDFYVK